MYTISGERPEDGPAIEAILDRAFGSERRRKASYRFRDHVAPEPRLSLVARDRGGAAVGTIRFWPLDVATAAATRPALLLGPVAVEPELKGQGIGRALIRAGLARATRAGHRLVLLVGDAAYYAPFGFEPAAQHGFVMQGEDPARLMALALVPNALAGGGMLVARRSVRRGVRRAA